LSINEDEDEESPNYCFYCGRQGRFNEQRGRIYFEL